MFIKKKVVEGKVGSDFCFVGRKVEKNNPKDTQIMNFKPIVLNQVAFSKSMCILKHHNLVCRTSYPKKRKIFFGVLPTLQGLWW